MSDEPNGLEHLDNTLKSGAKGDDRERTHSWVKEIYVELEKQSESKDEFRDSYNMASTLVLVKDFILFD